MLVESGDVIPADGEVIGGVASVDESAITGNPRRRSASRAVTFRGSVALEGVKWKSNY